VAIGDTLMSPEALAWARYGRLLIDLCVLGQPTLVGEAWFLSASPEASSTVAEAPPDASTSRLA
jgi:hypothetical protein